MAERDGDVRRADALSAAGLAEAVGGVRGLVDSSLPTVVFVAVAAVGTVPVAVGAALCAAALLAVVRALRGEPLRYTVSGLLGVGISALIALRLGRAEGFFLPGIAMSALYGAVFLGSLLIGKPIVAVLARALDRPIPSRRVAVAVTALWAAVFLARAGVQGVLYLAGEPGWLAAVRIGMGWPLTLVALGVTAAALRSAPRATVEPAG